MLRTSDAAGIMRNPHPPSSVTQMPRFRDSSASLGVAGARGGPPGTSGTGTTGRITSGTESLTGGAPSTPVSTSERRGKARAANVLDEDGVGGESALRPRPDVGPRSSSTRTKRGSRTEGNLV
jgi:hypothetical protein